MPVDDTTKEIDAQLKQDKYMLESELKLLLLGAGESGKSTIAKQMKIIHLNGFTDEEIKTYGPILQSNAIECTKLLLKACEDLDIKTDDSLKETAGKYLGMNTYGVVLDEEMGSELASLWADSGIQEAFGERSKFQLPDSCKYVLDDIARISLPNFVPTSDDILRCRARTTGIHEVLFQVNQYNYVMVDVGGQRSERKKWVHCFQDVTAIMFVVSMSAYDLKLYEDENVNRMHEAIQLFDEICNSKWFRETALILFLNKCDLFEEKIQKVDLSVCFSEYQGGLDYDAGCEFLKEKFKSLNRQQGKLVYMHITCATDTENIKFVFNATRDVVLQDQLDEIF